MSARAQNKIEGGAEDVPFIDSARLARLAAASRAELEALQLHKLRRQLARLHASSGYYRRRMDGAGIAPDALASLDVISCPLSALEQGGFSGRSDRAPALRRASRHPARRGGAGQHDRRDVGAGAGNLRPVSARHSHAGLSACVALVPGWAKAGRHCHQLRSRRRSYHRWMGSGRRSAHRRRDRVSCRRYVVDRCKNRSDAARSAR